MRKIFISALCLSLVSFQALAHKVVSSAWTDGQDIEGEVGFSNGDMAQAGLVVEVFNNAGEKIGETKVVDDGLFRFTPTQAIDHIFKANLGAGHVAELLFTKAELPENLAVATSTTSAKKTAEVSTPKPVAPSQGTAIPANFEKLIAKAVRKEVQPLRKEIASYKEKNDLQNILGGMGYIFGLFGIVFYIAARRKLSEKA